MKKKFQNILNGSKLITHMLKFKFYNLFIYFLIIPQHHFIFNKPMKFRAKYVSITIGVLIIITLTFDY